MLTEELESSHFIARDRSRGSHSHRSVDPFKAPEKGSQTPCAIIIVLFTIIQMENVSILNMTDEY